jgi:hypothetical protein
MSASIRVTITRPNTSVVWPFVQFASVTEANYTVMSQAIDTYLKGDVTNDLTVLVDHYFVSNDFFAENKSIAHEYIPLWKNTDNSAEVDSYISTNNITVTTEEVTDPDLTGYVPLESVPK